VKITFAGELGVIVTENVALATCAEAVNDEGLFATRFEGCQVVLALPELSVKALVGDALLCASVLKVIGTPAMPTLPVVLKVAVALQGPEPAT
jgi:hypothetical protein